MSDKTIEYVEEMNRCFKKAEHNLDYSLKLTRTVDMIKILIGNYIDTLINGFEAIVQRDYEQHKIFEIPESPIEKINLVKQNYPDNKELVEFVDWLLFLRKLQRSECTRTEEFRKNVTLGAVVDGEQCNVKIETLYLDHERMKGFLKLICDLFGDEIAELC